MSPRRASRTSKRRSKEAGIRGRVKAHDPFELIRWLAMSQTDPRKALAELVQNSLDASARHVRITRFRRRGVSCLQIFDDGEGVLPEMERAEALRYIATHIGHSRKRSLSPQERLQLLTQGQYGIGLLGFWSLGESLEMRSAVPGHRPQRLVLFRDDPTFRVEPIPGRLPLGERWTEILVTQLHPDAQRMLVARRAAEYLAAELRGQLLARDVEVVVEDRIARGSAQKRVTVRPPRFLGERIQGLDVVEVPGQPPIRLEVYWTGDTTGDTPAAGLHVYSAGTHVAEGFRELASLGLDRAPWTDLRLSGLVDFPAFRIAPGSRRGIVVDDAAEAFARSLESVEPALLAALQRFEERRAAELERGMIRDLQRAFRHFYRHRPNYALLPVSQANDAASGPGDGNVGGGGPGELGADGAEVATGTTPDSIAPAEEEPLPVPSLLPPGPLAEIRLRPGSVRVAPGTTRRIRAVATDASGRPVEEEVTFAWEVTGGVGTVEEEAGAPGIRVAATTNLSFRAADVCGEGRLLVFARAESGAAEAEAPLEVTEDLPDRGSDEGIPDPELIDAPGERWRSRMNEGRWQVNAGHPDFRELDGRSALKLRYLALLFAKEVVLHDLQDPRVSAPLEQLVEIAAYADRQFARKRRDRRGAAARGADASDEDA